LPLKRYAPSLVFCFGANASLVARFLQQEGQAGDLSYQLQEFGPPVFQGVSHDLERVAFTSTSCLMCALFVHVGEPAEYPVTSQHDHKQAPVSQVSSCFSKLALAQQIRRPRRPSLLALTSKRATRASPGGFKPGVNPLAPTPQEPFTGLRDS
jgi:hypothetical protein